MKFNRKKIITVLLILLIVSVILTITFNLIKRDNAKKIDLASSIYNRMHSLYLSGNGIEYVYDDTNNRKYIEEDTKYYEVKEKSVFEDLIAKESREKLLKIFNIKEKDNKYYISDFGRGMTNTYYGTILKIKKRRKNKIEYTAVSTLCRIDKVVSYAEGCTADGYYEIEKPFTIVKEDNKWKVLEYTSVFQFSDRELK